MTPTPLRLALFGAHLGQSRSGELFAAMAAAGGPVVKHQVLEVAPGAMGRALDRLRRGDWDGANITIPYKVEAAELVDELDPAASRAGAVNTIVRRDTSRLRGANTDGRGFVASLAALPDAARPKFRDGVSALLLGAGGAARGVAAALVDEGADTTIVTRHPNRAAVWAGPLGAAVMAWSDDGLTEAVRDVDLIVQTTPLGAAPAVERTPILPWDVVGPDHVVVDLIYNPWQSRFLELVRGRGAQGLNGWPMLVHQAALAVAMWSGPAASRALMEGAAQIEPRDPTQP